MPVLGIAGNSKRGLELDQERKPNIISPRGETKKKAVLEKRSDGEGLMEVKGGEKCAEEFFLLGD